MGRNPELSRKLLQRWNQKTGREYEEKAEEIKEEGMLNWDGEDITQEADNTSGHRRILSEAQNTLMEMKKTNGHLAPHLDNCFRQLGQILKYMKD